MRDSVRVPQEWKGKRWEGKEGKAAEPPLKKNVLYYNSTVIWKCKIKL